MKEVLFVVAIAFLGFVVMGYLINEPTATRSDAADLQAVVNSISYVRKDGHCFAILKSKPYRTSYSITWMPCRRDNNEQR